MNIFFTRSRRMWVRGFLNRDTKTKITWSLFILIFLIFFIDSFGFVKVYFEKDFETEFSYPLEVEDFPNLVNRFRNGEHVEYEPINTNYSAGIKFNKLANEDCGRPLGLVILIKSAPNYFEKRAAIRATWGNAQYLLNISNSISSTSSLISCFQNQLKKNSLNLSHSNLNKKHGSYSSPFPIKLVFLLGQMESEDQSSSTGKSSSGGSTATAVESSFVTAAIDNLDQGASKHDNLNSFNPNQITNQDEDAVIQKPKKSSRPKRKGRRREQIAEVEESLREEMLKYNDIVRGDFVDCYENNTFKAMMGLRWAVEICPDFQYSFLVDDDMYISMKNLIRFMENPKGYPEDNEPHVIDKLYAGKAIVTRPIRNKLGSKWYLSLDEYPFNYFPPYMPAAAVLMSKPVVQDLYYASYFTQHFRFDDVFLAILAHKMKISPLSSRYFHVCHSKDGKCPDNDIGTEKPKAGADPMENVIARHGLNGPKELINLWNQQKSAGKLLV